MENKLKTGAVFIDLRKAFDTVDQTLLIRKLKHIGLSEAVVNWFLSYLSLRTAVTSISNITSSPKPVTVSVPRGMERRVREERARRMRIIEESSAYHTYEDYRSSSRGSNETEFSDSFQAREKGEGHKDKESTATWGQVN